MTCSKVQKCRICSNTHLELVLDLGLQELTGVFPKSLKQSVTRGPLRLVKCNAPVKNQESDVCGLLQLQHSYDLHEMYGENYGYRSGLNESMVNHLHAKIKRILCSITLEPDDLIIDIGSNDCTTLRAYPQGEYQLVGIDPTALKFQEYYPDEVILIADFFSSSLVEKKFSSKGAKIITSFSMFYDLEDPMSFMQEIYDILSADGVWVFEQSYLPRMLEQNAYDTACHEHLEYYSLFQIKWMADRVGFCITDLEFNEINGGSFSVSMRKTTEGYVQTPEVERVLFQEKKDEINNLTTYEAFAQRVENTKRNLLECISDICARGESVHALGASTKGNVLLQYCELSNDMVLSIGEVNPEKYGHFTPGTRIPIVPEDQLVEDKPDYLIVLPWHFRDFFLSSSTFLGMKLIFPLPNVEIVEVK